MEFVNVMMGSLDASASATTETWEHSVRTLINVDQQIQQSPSAVERELACAVNVNATLVKIQRRKFMDHFVNATTFRAIVTKVFCVRVQSMELVNVERANVMKVGQARIALAAPQRKIAWALTAQNVPVVEHASVENVFVKKAKLDIRENSAISVQLVLESVLI